MKNESRHIRNVIEYFNAESNQLSMYEHFVKDNTAKFYLTERNIYGSSRLGVTNDTINMFIPEILPSYGILGNRTYELSNHLGNVLTTISDIKYPLSDDNVSISGYEVGINGISDYSPFGAPLDGRTVGRLGKYGFNSQERDNEVSGDGNSYTAEFWQYSPRLGRRWEIDPVPQIFISDYSVLGNNPLINIDIKGNKWKDKNDQKEADESIKVIENKIKRYKDDLSSYNDKAREALKNDDLNTADKFVDKIEETLSAIDELSTLANDLHRMGDPNEEIIFHFNNLGRHDGREAVEGYTSWEGEGWENDQEFKQINLNYYSRSVEGFDISESHRIHEISHGADVLNGLIEPFIKGTPKNFRTGKGIAINGRFYSEIKAFRIQYFISNSRRPLGLKSVKDIDEKFLKIKGYDFQKKKY